MRCAECNTENPKVARFCLKCGTLLVLVCPQCQTELPAHAEFCFACGSRVSTASPDAAEAVPVRVADRLQCLVPAEYAERLLATRGQVSAERRMVTILFSDVKGSTAMAEKLDPEDVMEIMDGAFDVLIEPVYRYEGTLARLMGDAVLAFFGAPIAHEDDAQRACLAALDIIASAQEYAARLEQERGITGFDVRVGIHTGLVVVGEVGTDLRVEYTAMGDAVNLAARLESAAEPGTVLISGATHKLVAPLFETEALGPVEVKGKAEPVAVYRVLEQKDVHGKVRGIAGLESPLVGREAELAALQEAVERLRAGVGGVVTVVGEAGIGKSRLVAELHKQATVGAYVGAQHAAPQRWVEGRCLSYGTSIAYLLWLDVLRGLLGVTVEEGPANVRDALQELLERLCPVEGDELLPYLARTMSLPLQAGEEAVLRDLEGEQLKAGTFQAVEWLVEAVAREQPLVLVLEDLHWADPTSLELLERLLALTDRASLLLVCIFRPRRECGCWRIREVAARDYPHRHTDVWLEPLSSAESEVLVRNLLRAEGIPAWFRERILSVTEGNPFYVEEVLRGLIDQGVVVDEGGTGHWQVAEAAAIVRLPDTLQGALVARIDRLQEDARRVLQMAAVIGRVFLYRILEAIAAEERELDQRLLTLQREEMIRERARIPELEYIFKHELTREAAYNGLLKAERRAFHRQVAGALERLFPERVEEQVGLLAYHWKQAGDGEKATEYLLKAGDRARLAYAHQEAVDYYQRALAFLKDGEEHERAARTLMKLGLTYHNAFEFRAARQAYEEGFALWRRGVQTPPVVLLLPAPHGLRVQWSEVSTLDQARANEMSSAAVIAQLFSGLVQLNQEMDVLPDVAERWEVLDGGRRYVFHLREDVVWSDGVPVTAGDFCYAWLRVLAPSTGSAGAELLYDLRGARAFHQGQARAHEVGVRAVDQGTLVAELERPTGYFLQVLAHGGTFPVPRHVVEALGEAWAQPGKIVTNGPFRLASWQQGESLGLVRNPVYHGRFTGNLERVELAFHDQEEWSELLAMYEAGDLDALPVNAMPLPDRQRAKGKYAGELMSYPWFATQYLAFAATGPPLDDLRVRRALVLGIDRDMLAAADLGGWGVPASGGFVPPGMPGHSPGIGLPYDPEGARQLLAEAGYAGGLGFPPVEAFSYGTSPAYEGRRQTLQAYWQENLGVGIRWRVVDAAAFYEAQRDQAGLFLLGWIADYPDPHSFLSEAAPEILRRWGNEAYDRLVAEASRITDQVQRVALYKEADRMLMEEAVIVPLTYGQNHMLVKPWVSRYFVTPMAGLLWKDVVIEPH